MAISVADNFSYLGGKPLDGRIQYATVADMKAMADAKLYEGCEAYCVATDKYYKWKSTNTVDTTLGKWREIESGGSGLPSGGTAGQYLVKQSATEGDADWQSLNAFTGATSEAAGAAGLVPAPAIGDEGKVLFGNGSWGNIVMPSVDYSQQSVEANIFDTTEKVIGQWIDGKLLYQKTITNTYPNTTGTTLAEKSIEHGIANIDKIINVSGFHGYNVNAAVNYISPGNLAILPQALHANRTYLWIRNSNSDWSGDDVFITIKYTKTTDSPLASDEKFAGLTASGEVIYKKQINGSIQINDNQRHHDDLIDLASLSINDVVKFEGTWSDSGNTVKNIGSADTEFYFSIRYNKSTKYLQSTNMGLLNENIPYKIVIYYTKTS